MRVGEELRGIWASLRLASKRSSIGSSLLFAIALRRMRLAAFCFESFMRRLFFSIELVFAIYVLRALRLAERELHLAQQCPCLIVGLGRRAHNDVHAPDRLGFVVVDLGENDVFLDAEREVAAPVEALRIEAAEVANARQS